MIPEDADRLHVLAQHVPVASALALMADLEAIGHAVADVVGDHPLLPRIRAILVLAETVAQLLEQLRAAIEVAAQHHHSVAAASMGKQSPLSVEARAASAPHLSVAASESYGADDADKRAADLLATLPVRNENQRKTMGYWIDEDGQERGPLVSGRAAGYKETVEQLKALGIGPGRGDLWAAAHVEVKLVVQLRKTATRAVTLVINNAPCAEGRWSCDQLLPQILQPGQCVVIYWPDGKGVYRGRKS